MTALCLVLFLNLNGDPNYVNIHQITAVEKSGPKNENTLIWMNRPNLTLTTKESLESVMTKIKKASAFCPMLSE